MTSVITTTPGAAAVAAVNAKTEAEARALTKAVKDLVLRLDRAGITYTRIEAEVDSPRSTVVGGRVIVLTPGQRDSLPRLPVLSVACYGLPEGWTTDDEVRAGFEAIEKEALAAGYFASL